MRLIVLAAVLGAGSTLAFAGPSDHAGRSPGDPGRAGRPEIGKADRPGRAPYALTGERVQRRVIKFRDIQKGRGQTERVPFWTWVTE